MFVLDDDGWFGFSFQVAVAALFFLVSARAFVFKISWCCWFQGVNTELGEQMRYYVLNESTNLNTKESVEKKPNSFLSSSSFDDEFPDRDRKRKKALLKDRQLRPYLLNGS